MFPCSPAVIRARMFAVALALAPAACGDRSAASPSEPAPAAEPAAVAAPGAPPPAAAAPAAARAPAVPLAESPRIDLVANRFRWHLYRRGLHVPLASEGLRKYSQEYTNPWGEPIELDGRTGRVLAARGATLRVPWDADGPATLLVRAHGGGRGQRLTLHVNERGAVNATLAPGWNITAVAIPAGLLRAGENQLRLSVATRERLGGATSYGLWHSLELIGGDAASDGDWPPLSPARDGGLGGFPRLALVTEVPRDAFLVLGADEGQLSVRATDADGAAVTLLAHDGPAARHTIPLDALAGRLVRLELESPASATWAEPAIALAQAAIRPRPRPAANGIVFVIDALRADRLAVYAPDTSVRTPTITEAANAYGVVMAHNQAASPSSPPSHGSIQTGMIPRVHGVVGDNATLAAGTPMMSTELGAAGVATAYYGNNPFGMARLERPGRWTEFHQPTREGKGIDCIPLVEGMLDFARRQSQAGKRWFISALPYEPHTPYRYHPGVTDHYFPGPWDEAIVGRSVDGVLLDKVVNRSVKLTDAQWAQLRALYDGEVEHVDGCVGQLLAGLEALGQREDTALIITSDHGEGMFEHGRMGHAYGHYAELGNVPFIVLYPGLGTRPVRIDTVTSHLDIAPTLLDLMGVPIPDTMQGMSLVRLIMRDGPWTPRVVSLEYGRSYGLRAADWKYIVDYQQTESVYDLRTDPLEQHDLLDRNPLALRYLREIAGFFLAHRSAWRFREHGAFNDHAAGFLRLVAAPDK